MKKVSYDLSGEPVTHRSHSAKFVCNKSCDSRDKKFLICDVTSYYHIIKRHMTLWVDVTLSSHFAKFDAYRSCGSADITFQLCNETSCDHMIKRTCDFLSRNPSP